MKEVVYTTDNREKKFILTDSEFAEAMACWNNNENYFCIRLDASLTRYYKWAETPLEDKGYEVFMEVTPSGVKKRFKRGDEYFTSITNPDGTKSKFPITNVDKKKLISQEEYYQERKLLT